MTERIRLFGRTSKAIQAYFRLREHYLPWMPETIFWITPPRSGAYQAVVVDSTIPGEKEFFRAEFIWVYDPWNVPGNRFAEVRLMGNSNGGRRGEDGTWERSLQVRDEPLGILFAPPHVDFDGFVRQPKEEQQRAVLAYVLLGSPEQ